MVSLTLGAAVQAAETASKNCGPAETIAVTIICGLIAFLAWNLICNDDSPPMSDQIVNDEINPDHEQWI